MENYLQALEGISYGDWVKLRTAIDRAFIIQKVYSERKLKLVNTDVVREELGKWMEAFDAAKTLDQK